MGSIYPRGDVLWMKYKAADGTIQRKSTGYRCGQEPVARELLAEVERQVASQQPVHRVVVAAPNEGAAWLAAEGAPTIASQNVDGAGQTPAPAGATSGQVTVRQYAKQWLERRSGQIATVADERRSLDLHVFPLIGDMALADVRPRHVRDAVNALKNKTSNAKKCRGEKLAPRTVRHVYALMRRMFKSAVVDELIVASPIVVEKGTLPKNVDKDPSWRASAIFDRGELVKLITDERIPELRRMQNALKGLAALRHGEAAGLRWSDYDTTCSPLGKLVIARSYEKSTKTQVTREVPVHPSSQRCWTNGGRRGGGRCSGAHRGPTIS